MIAFLVLVLVSGGIAGPSESPSEVELERIMTPATMPARPTTSPAKKYFRHGVVVTPAYKPPVEPRQDPDTMRFTVTNRWGGRRILLDVGFEAYPGVLKSVRVEDANGAAYTVWPDKIVVDSGPVVLTRKQIDWEVWKDRHLQMRKEAIRPPPK
jgi:hypothetical protein